MKQTSFTPHLTLGLESWKAIVQPYSKVSYRPHPTTGAATKVCSGLSGTDVDSTNIFKYSFVDFWTTEYIWIFFREFLEIPRYLNISSEPYSNISLSMFNEKCESGYILCIK